jgi:hypothetical protein
MKMIKSFVGLHAFLATLSSCMEQATSYTTLFFAKSATLILIQVQIEVNFNSRSRSREKSRSDRLTWF